MSIHDTCITDIYMTHMCLYELEIMGKELVKKGVTAYYRAAHTSIAFFEEGPHRQMTASVIFWQ